MGVYGEVGVYEGRGGEVGVHEGRWECVRGGGSA